MCAGLLGWFSLHISYFLIDPDFLPFIFFPFKRNYLHILSQGCLSSGYITYKILLSNVEKYPTSVFSLLKFHLHFIFHIFLVQTENLLIKSKKHPRNVNRIRRNARLSITRNIAKGGVREASRHVGLRRHVRCSHLMCGCHSHSVIDLQWFVSSQLHL